MLYTDYWKSAIHCQPFPPLCNVCELDRSSFRGHICVSSTKGRVQSHTILKVFFSKCCICHYHTIRSSKCQPKKVCRKRNQGILKGEVSLYHWPPVWLVWISLLCKKKKNFQLSYSWFQTSQTGGQWYSDTSLFVFPGETYGKEK
jgi:hypothetical protein